MDGNHLWQADVGQESDPAKWGSSSSPILHEDTVIITAAAESQSIVGLDKATGNELWRQPASRLDNMWGTPSLVVIDENRTDLVMCIPGEIWGLDPNSGKLRWYAETAQAEQVDTSAVTNGTRVYAFSGRGGGSIAIDAGGSGNVTKSKALWTGPTTARFSSPVRHGSQLYLISRRVLTVIDANTGKRIDQVRLQGARRKEGRSGGDNYSSPIIQGDRLFYPNGSGQVFVFALGEEPKQLAVNPVTTEPEMFGGSPAVSDGRLLLRSNKHLYCITDFGQKVNSSQIVIAQEEQEEPDEEQDSRRRTGGRRRIDPMNLFTRRDTNNDGELTEDELSSGSVSQRIAGLDKDGDKVVTKEEFRAGAATISRRRSGASRPQRPERPELAE